MAETSDLAVHGSSSEESAASRALQLGHQGLIQFKAGAFQQAYDAFLRAESLVHSPAFVLYQARAASRLGRLLLAQQLLEKCANENLLPSSPVAWAQAVRDAKAELHHLEAAIPQVRLHFPPATSFPVMLGGIGAVVEITEASSSVRVDPGEYLLVATDANGAQSQENLLAKRGNRAVHLSFRWKQREDEGDTPTESSHSAEYAAVEHPYMLPAVVAWGSSAVAFGVAAGAFGEALSQAKALKEPCEGNRCPYEDRFKQYEARRWANLATASVVVGSVGAVVGTTLFFLRTGNDGTLTFSLTAQSMNVRGEF